MTNKTPFVIRVIISDDCKAIYPAKTFEVAMKQVAEVEASIQGAHCRIIQTSVNEFNPPKYVY